MPEHHHCSGRPLPGTKVPGWGYLPACRTATHRRRVRTAVGRGTNSPCPPEDRRATIRVRTDDDPPRRCPVRFRDRKEAGRLLAERLETLRGQDVVVLGLPRGGVPVGAEVARALGVPLDVIVVRKVGVPFQHELAMGAVGEGGVLVVNERVVRLAHVGPDELERAEQRERAELESRVQRFRGERPRVPLEGRTAVVVDDGIATGSTARAACCRRAGPGGGADRPGRPGLCPGERAGARVRRRRDGLPGDAPGLPRGRPVLRRLPPDRGRRGGRPPGARRPGPSHPQPGPSRRGGPGERRLGAAGGPSRRPGARPRAGGLRPRQRQQPAQPAQPLRREAPRRRPASRPCCSTC